MPIFNILKMKYTSDEIKVFDKNAKYLWIIIFLDITKKKPVLSNKRFHRYQQLKKMA